MGQLIGRRILIGIALVICSWLVFVYPWQRLISLSQGLSALTLIEILTLWILPIALFVIWMKQRSPMSALFGQISVNWLGVCMMFMWATVGAEIIRLGFGVSDKTTTIIIIIGGINLCVYAIYKATKIEIIEFTLKSNKLTKAYKSVHLSDIHLGSRSVNFVKKVIQQTNHLNPDLVFITGDLIDMTKVKPELLDILREFISPVYFIKGNHDRYINSNKHFEVIDKTDVITLDNRSLMFEELQIIGISDTAHSDQLEKTLPTIDVDHSRFSILLYHKPEETELAASQGIDLMLCGHTHSGQIFPFNYVVKKYFPFMKGLFTINNLKLYVSQGTGTWGPTMRLGTHNEMTIINIKPH